MKRKSLNLAFRIQPLNRFTFPVLLNQVENQNLDLFFNITFIENFHQLRKFVSSNPKGILLYSFMTPQLMKIQTEVEWILANRNVELHLLAGGPHTTGDPLSSLKMGFDYAYAGAAETGFADFLKKFLMHQIPDHSTIFYADELNNLDYSLPVTRYMNIMPPLEITRGCYWNCKFCQTACQKARHRSLESIEHYYGQLKETGFHRRVSFITPSAFEFGAQDANHLNPDLIQNLLDYCKRNGTQYLEYGIFPSETRPNTINEKLVELVAAYCSNNKITIGAQSGSNRVLKLIRRGHTVEDIRNACEQVYRKKLIPQVDIIMGFPGEESTDRHETLYFMKELNKRYKARIQVHHFLPLAGTVLENTIPSKLDDETVKILKKYQQDGICTNWWENGRQLAQELIHIQSELNNLEISFQNDYSLISQ